jgi:hypothetical protein
MQPGCWVCRAVEGVLGGYVLQQQLHMRNVGGCHGSPTSGPPSIVRAGASCAVRCGGAPGGASWSYRQQHWGRSPRRECEGRHTCDERAAFLVYSPACDQQHYNTSCSSSNACGVESRSLHTAAHFWHLSESKSRPSAQLTTRLSSVEQLQQLPST